jgi:phosphoribosyl 1,2-cyclic phosphodiesterase
MIYEKQPIENAAVSVFEDNGFKMLVIEPTEGYKLRQKGDNTYSTMKIMFSAEFEDLLDNYHAVPIDTPDEEVEKPPILPTEDEELSAEEALSIITGGVSDETV